MILQIGNHQFDIDLSYETLERAAAWEWGEVPIVGDYPILQNVRKESPTLTFTGQWFNYVATGDRVQNLEDLGNEGEPLAVTGDTGFFYGFWVIQSLRRAEEVFRPGQHSAIKTQWTLSLKFFGDKKERGQ